MGPIMISFCVYLLMMVGIGLWAYFKTSNLDDYILGGRSLGPWVTALSAAASDMSGWALLGLPGAVYANGLKETWMIFGLLMGAYYNWTVVAPRLRVYTERLNVLTIPEYLEKRLQTKSPYLKIVSSLIILGFFTFYTASGLVAGAKLFSSSFGLDYQFALFLGTFVILLYTVTGGFLAVSWTDFIQGILMAGALVVVPTVLYYDILGYDVSAAIHEKSSLTNISFISVLSLMSWGLGYMGQPHILTRFMAISDVANMRKAKRIAMVWMLIVTVCAVAVGFLGFIWFDKQGGGPELVANPEVVFIILTKTLFNPWVAGILLAAILAAVMSTIDSQLLVCSSALTSDFYKGVLKPEASDKELVWVSRVSVLGVSLVGLAIATDPNSQVLSLVSYAWAGLGAGFGPVIILSLTDKRLNLYGAVSGMITGAVTVVVWKQLEGGIFDLYELLPAFALSYLLTFTLSRLTRSPSQSVEKVFDDLQMNRY